MKLKLAVIYGMIVWILIFIISSIFNPIFTDNLPQVNRVVPLSIIIVTGFFGILYIRVMETNEVVEGIMLGVVFIVVDIILDMLFFILPNNKIPIVENYPLHIISMIIITILITTFLGYLAQMKIDLK